MKSLTTLLICALFIALLPTAYATHNLGGYISYRQISLYTIEATVTTFTKTSGQSQFADRPELEIHWGDGQIQVLARSNGLPDLQGVPAGELISPNIKKNEYTATHSYAYVNNPNHPQPSRFYTLWVQDPNRNEDILNINGGNSVNIEFHIASEIYLAGSNEPLHSSSAIPTIPLKYTGVLGQVFQFTPNGILCLKAILA